MKFDAATELLNASADVEEFRDVLTSVGFSDWQVAARRIRDMADNPRSREALARCLPMLLITLSDAASPDGSLVNFERYAQSVDDRAELFDYLASNPRTVEILVKLFVGSQFLTEILLRHPDYLRKLTQHKRVAEFKSRHDFVEEAREAQASAKLLDERLNAVRRFQRWELLRIGACDSFGLLDLKSVTLQLSLLADAMVQSCLALLAGDLGLSTEGFVVLGFGKLGGEELNYSSDIDLVFLARDDATQFWSLGQRLIKALMDPTAEGFLYRVDMRLRPWGKSGALVNSVDAHVNYLTQHGMLWEKQALLKARPIAGDLSVGEEFLRRVETLVYNVSSEAARENIREMKERIETGLGRKQRDWGEVKSGAGSIRDVEFITQYLQLAHGGTHSQVRSINTLDGLIRLAEAGFVQGDEYRMLTDGYIFLRTIEHSLQLMHYKQTHVLPNDPREQAYLARRLDFPDAAQFLAHYERHQNALRAIFDRYIGGEAAPAADVSASPAEQIARHRERMEPSYAQTFSEEEIQRHAELLERLSEDNLVEVRSEPADDGLWRVTIAGYDHLGELSLICGLLFVYGFDILSGDVFTAVQESPESTDQGRSARKFVDAFTVRPPLEVTPAEVWARYKQDLGELVQLLRADRQREAQGQVAKRVAARLREPRELSPTLYPVEIELDNEASDRATVLHIQSEDTIGFLYEFSNALTTAGIHIWQVTIRSVGNQVIDTLSVTEADGTKLTNPDRQQQLRAVVVLIKHFTHLLPRSPNPESALLHFRSMLEQLLGQPQGLLDIASLERPEVLDALAQLLGVSDFLWEDFLRLQHSNLFPLVTNLEALDHRKPQAELWAELNADSNNAQDVAARRELLNAFKDREMFRIDMRHIMGRIDEFGQFSAELTDVAEVVVDAAYRLCRDELESRYGRPQLADGGECPMTVCALGKCGGRELGFASDIELMFVYEADGRTSGAEQITNAEFFQRLVESFNRTIEARREGIFHIDLRLRPYGRAGSLAVSWDAFSQYFAPQGAAWPYERQALVKLRPIAGDEAFGQRLVELRDELVYTGEPFDVVAMRAMREKQVRQLVKAGTTNAKLSPGGLVDVEYLVQGLQITHGCENPELRATNTRKAMAALKEAGVISAEQYDRMYDAYVFLRRMIDALRMVRGDAKELTVPPDDSEEFQFLARRLGYGFEVARLANDLERATHDVQELSDLLETKARE